MSRINSFLDLPTVVYGTSSLGNLYEALPESKKLAVVEECLRHSEGRTMFDTAGKYGAGLALESLERCFSSLGISPGEVVISNKLGWYRTELVGSEPTFEPGVWRGLTHDAEQRISYRGILECFEQGNELLGRYVPQVVSVHDPDEYLANAKDAEEDSRLYSDILESYRALADLKVRGRVQAFGVGAKDWRVIRRIASDVELDWVMLANSMTVRNHPSELVDFMEELQQRGVKIINSAIFHGGFLIGGDYYNYTLVKPDTEEHKALFRWRKEFFALCREYDILPAMACIHFALRAPGVSSVALSSSNPERIRQNAAMVQTSIPREFWWRMKNQGLIREDYPYVG
jgi:D-threo-aldose 1-dehydrogenase